MESARCEECGQVVNWGSPGHEMIRLNDLIGQARGVMVTACKVGKTKSKTRDSEADALRAQLNSLPAPTWYRKE